MDIEPLEGQLAALERQAVVLAVGLRAAAADLRRQQQGISRGLLHSLEEFHTQYTRLCARLVPDRQSDRERPTLPELVKACAHQQTRREAAALLQPVLQIVRIDGAATPLLDQVYDECRGLREDLRQSHSVRTLETAESVLRGEHWLAVLLRLVTQGELLSDEEWTRCLEVVQSASKELAVAVARHKLILRNEPPGASEVSSGGDAVLSSERGAAVPAVV